MAKYNQGIAGAREYRRLYIVNGSELVTATKQQAFLPYDGGEDNVDVFSGQPVARVPGDFGTKFVKATDDNASATIYWATSDSTDKDVLASGKLGAIYTGDKFEIQTPFFDTTKTYLPGDKLVLNAEGKVTVLAIGEGEGEFESESAAAGKIIGVVSAGVIEFGAGAPITVETVSDKEYIQGGPSVWVNDTGSQKVLQFYTVAE